MSSILTGSTSTDNVSDAPPAVPRSVRYIKNGPAGRWWGVAKARSQLHAGWDIIPRELLRADALPEIEARIRAEFGARRGATQDYNAIRALLLDPARHLWITFEEGCMWWCTVTNRLGFDALRDDAAAGHFWVEGATPWSNKSLHGRGLFLAELPGIVTATAGFRATICEPAGWREILRIVADEIDEDVAAATLARKGYESSVSKLVSRLRPGDFELLIDLILVRTGWVRIAKIGGPVEGVDMEVENAAINETAFVQVKSRADQAMLTDYAQRFAGRRDRYHRMIFAVHDPIGTIELPAGEPIQLWTAERIAGLIVRLGLGDWLAKRV